VVRNIASIIRDFDLQMQPFDAFTLHTLVAMQSNLPGVMAEVGVYRGGSSKIISLASCGRETYSFDTFSGCRSRKRSILTLAYSGSRRGTAPAGYDSVVRSLSEFPNLHFVRGFFPESGDVLKDKRISFANVDVDLYDRHSGFSALPLAPPAARGPHSSP
jgi:O-methyltransferase